MERVTGIGGVFIKARDPKALAAWYQKHLGIEFGDQSYVAFQWVNPDNPNVPGQTTFSFFKKESKYFDPSEKEFMIDLRVRNLKQLMSTLKEEGVQVVGEFQETDYGNFGWIMDPEGNKIELWEAKD